MKHFGWKQNDRIVQAPPRPRPVRILTGLFLLILITLFIAAMGIVDNHSRTVGWNQRRTEFAIAFTQNEARVTVFGFFHTFSLEPAYHTAAWVQRVDQGVELLRPAPERLAKAAGACLMRAEGQRVQRACISLWEAAQRLASSDINLH